jgi:acetyl esterase/lipase
VSDRVIDPEARAYLEQTAALGLPPLAQQGAVEARRLNSLRAPSLAGELEEVARIENGRMPGPGGDIPFRVYSPAPDRVLPALLYLHGGGWVVGDLDTHDSVCRALARRAECVVLALDYRLAPENRFPAAVEDAWTGLNWLHDNAADFGADPQRIAVGGDSSGGNLSAVVARRARDRQGPKLAAQILIYPVTDCDFDTPSYRDAATGYGLTRDSMLWYWDQYLPDESNRVSPDASPLRAPDLTGLAPALLISCGLDPLASEGVAYAEALKSAGVRVEHHHEPDMIHGYIRMNGVVSRARKSWDDCARFLRREFQAGD